MAEIREIQKLMPTRRWIRIFGLLAILGGAGGMVADALSLWIPEPGVWILSQRDVSGRLMGMLAEKSSASLLAGSLLGLAALPLHMFGFFLMATALEPAGKRGAAAFFAAACFMAAIGAGFHGSIALVGEAARAGDVALFARMMDLWIPWWWMMTLGFGIVSTLLLWMILFSNTRYPRWTAWLSPVSLGVAGGGSLWILMALGAPFGLVWFLAVCGINLPLLVFHAVTLWVLCNETMSTE